MSELLYKLAEKLGISTSFTYVVKSLSTNYVSEDLLRFFINSMGYKAGNDEEIQHSLDRIEKSRWLKTLEPIYVVQQDNVFFDIVLSNKYSSNDLQVFYAPEGSNSFSLLDVMVSERQSWQNATTLYTNYLITVKNKLDFGYYDIKIKIDSKEYVTKLAVAPRHCYHLDKKGKNKLFGFTVQLYSLKSRRNWGVGDFTDLINMVDLVADSGGDVIGLNPLNVLLHDYPENASPYASISRLFLNPIYIDVEKVPFYEDADKNLDVVNNARNRDIIDYTAVYNAKIQALQKIYDRLMTHPQDSYYKEFQKFKKINAEELNKLAVYQSIYHQRAITGDWGKYNPMLDSSVNSAIGKFVEEFSDEIDFFKFLQFEADRQLNLVEKKIKERNLIIGLYRDLPVGVSKDSVEVWGDKYLYMQESGAGAPPDSNFPTGQKWGLGAFNPFELKERCYKPFIQILRANMRYAGAIRIDHVMGLSRLFLIPDQGKDGTYLAYNVQDMLNIVALESCLNKCVVVGECIGNVAEGFVNLLKERNMYSLGVFKECRKNDGDFCAPDEYEEKYFASAGTHDMPPLKAWWFGSELSLMRDLKMVSQEDTYNNFKWREHERWLLLNAMDREGVWPQDKPRKGDYLFGEGYPEGIEEAVHSYMAKTKSEVLLLQPEDIFQSMKIQNLPGTDVDKYPNWRTKLPVDIEDMAASEAYQRNLKAVKKWR